MLREWKTREWLLEDLTSSQEAHEPPLRRQRPDNAQASRSSSAPPRQNVRFRREMSPSRARHPQPAESTYTAAGGWAAPVMASVPGLPPVLFTAALILACRDRAPPLLIASGAAMLVGGLAAGLPPEAGTRVVRVTDAKGDLERTVFLPDPEEDEGRFVLVSDSSSNRYHEPELVKKKVVKRRRRRKKPAGYGPIPANLTDLKDPKFLNLFTIVRFGNEDCGEGGICYHEYECNQLGGTVQGPCAKGFGVCCTLEASCGETTGKAQTLFVGGKATGACTLSLEKMPCTKQIRLDFYSLQLEGPVDGNCLTDRLLVAGQNINSIVPIICGENSGQHMHFDVDESPGPVMVSVISPSRRDFRMKVTQLCESDPLLAPRGCLQYFTKNTGLIQSFNYQEPPQDSSYMNNMNYAMCIRKGPGMCSIEYENADSLGKEFAFDINNLDLEGDMTVPEGEAGAEVFNCPEDYLTIASVRLCGQRFNDASVEADFTKSAPVSDKSAGPFMMTFVSSPTNTGRGFRLQYNQQPC